MERKTRPGRIESDLRAIADRARLFWGAAGEFHDALAVSQLMETRFVLWDAAKSLGMYEEYSETTHCDPDVLSEAIEAAEALGL